MNLDQLQELLASPEFNRLPMEQALADASNDDRWWQLHDLLVEKETQVAIWSAGQHARLLFETYGTAIDRVKVDIETETNSGEIYINHRLAINDIYCDDDYSEFEDEDAEFLDLLDERDERAVFNAAVSALNDVASSHMLSHLDRLQAAFKKPLRSLADVDAMLAAHSPYVCAWVNAQRLSDVASQTASPDRSISGPARHHKM